MDLAGRRVLWKTSAWRDAANSLVKGPGGKMLVLLATANPAAVVALDLPTGQVVWRQAMIAGSYAASQRSAGAWNIAYVPGGHMNVPGGPRGGFYALEGATGRVLWAYERPGVFGAAAIISDGALYGLDAQGFLYKFIPAAA
jgi:outer membrane protein assembly factor BamB